MFNKIMMNLDCAIIIRNVQVVFRVVPKWDNAMVVLYTAYRICLDTFPIFTT